MGWIESKKSTRKLGTGATIARRRDGNGHVYTWVNIHAWLAEKIGWDEKLYVKFMLGDGSHAGKLRIIPTATKAPGSRRMLRHAGGIKHRQSGVRVRIPIDRGGARNVEDIKWRIARSIQDDVDCFEIDLPVWAGGLSADRSAALMGDPPKIVRAA